MSKIVCIKKCFDGGRVWKVGETRVLGKGQKMSKHFEAYAPKAAPTHAETKAEVRAQRDATLAAVGHGPQGAAKLANEPKADEAKGEDFLK